MNDPASTNNNYAARNSTISDESSNNTKRNVNFELSSQMPHESSAMETDLLYDPYQNLDYQQSQMHYNQQLRQPPSQFMRNAHTPSQFNAPQFNTPLLYQNLSHNVGILQQQVKLLIDQNINLNNRLLSLENTGIPKSQQLQFSESISNESHDSRSLEEFMASVTSSVSKFMLHEIENNVLFKTVMNIINEPAIYQSSEVLKPVKYFSECINYISVVLKKGQKLDADQSDRNKVKLNFHTLIRNCWRYSKIFDPINPLVLLSKYCHYNYDFDDCVTAIVKMIVGLFFNNKTHHFSHRLLTEKGI